MLLYMPTRTTENLFKLYRTLTHRRQSRTPAASKCIRHCLGHKNGMVAEPWIWSCCGSALRVMIDSGRVTTNYCGFTPCRQGGPGRVLLLALKALHAVRRHDGDFHGGTLLVLCWSAPILLPFYFEIRVASALNSGLP